MCVCVSHLVRLWLHIHRSRSELDGLVFEDVTKAEPSDLKRRRKKHNERVTLKGTIYLKHLTIRVSNTDTLFAWKGKKTLFTVRWNRERVSVITAAALSHFTVFLSVPGAHVVPKILLINSFRLTFSQSADYICDLVEDVNHELHKHKLWI